MVGALLYNQNQFYLLKPLLYTVLLMNKIYSKVFMYLSMYF